MIFVLYNDCRRMVRFWRTLIRCAEVLGGIWKRSIVAGTSAMVLELFIAKTSQLGMNAALYVVERTVLARNSFLAKRCG